MDSLKKSCDQINAELIAPAPIQKIFSTHWTTAMSLRVPGKTIQLVIGKGRGVEGLILEQEKPPVPLRQQESFLAFLRSHCTGGVVQSVRADELDRCAVISYMRSGLSCALGLFWKARTLYFFLSRGSEVFRSWTGVFASELNRGFDLFDEVGRRQLGSPKRSKDVPSLQSFWWREEAKRMHSLPTDKRQTKRARKKVEAIQGDLETLQSWRELQEYLLTEHEGVSSDTLQLSNGVKIKAPKNFSAYQKRDYFFEKLKRWKSLEEVQRQRLEKAVDEMKQKPLESGRALPVVSPELRAPRKVDSSKASEKQKALPSEVLIIELQAARVALGKTVQANDWLRSKWSKKQDIWAHLDGATSAHLYVKLTPYGRRPTSQELSEMGEILARHHDIADSKVPLLYTYVKFLRSVKDSPGLVKYRHEKHLLVDRSGVLPGD